MLAATGTLKVKRHRSPQYPYLNLAAAIEKAEMLYAKTRRHAAPFVMVAKHTGYKATSGAASKAIAAMKKYGLIGDEGKGQDRQIKLSELGLQIVEDKRPGSFGRAKAIRQAALTPKLYAQLWEKWGGDLPTDDDVKYHLVRVLGFTKEGARSAASDYRLTLAFAKLDSSAITADIESPESRESPSHEMLVTELEVGSFAQWTCQGVMQFKEPRRITGLSDDGDWAFVEGSQTGVPVSELTIEKIPNKPTAPPANPVFRPIPPDQGTKEFPLYLSGGRRALLRIPEQMTAGDFELLETQITSSLSITKATTTFIEVQAEDPAQ